MRSVLLALHLLSAVLWVGGMAFALAVLRPSLAVLEPPQRLALHGQVFTQFFRVIWHAMPLVLLTGYGMLFGVYGGFGSVNVAVHTMHLLGWIMTAVFIYVFFWPWKAMRAALDASDRAAAAAQADHIRKLITLNLALGLIVVVDRAIWTLNQEAAMARAVFHPVAAGLGLLLVAAASHAAMAPIVQDAETQHFQMELTVGPMEHMYTQAQAARLKPKDGEVMMSGHMAPMSVTSSTPTGVGMRHLEVSVTNKDDGSPVPNAKVSITIINSMSTQPVIVPVAVMHGVDEDESMLHYGNNVMLSPGHHRVIVNVNGDRATFDVNIPLM